ncbi:MAG: amidohydrolase family protein [Eggerthellaceae bacterium]|jgi:5-methylthioadenosine/S-adenosylhomocysteine deaminase
MLLCAQYILPITSDPIMFGAILVRNGKIRDIGTAEMLRLRYPDEEVREYDTAALLPGFVDVHTHMEYAVMRGVINDEPFADWKVHLKKKESLMTASDWYDSAIFGGLDALSSGVTTIADITDIGASVDAAQKLGLRAVVYREVGAADKSRVDNVIRLAERDIDDWMGRVDSGRITVGIAPYALYSCHPLIFKRVAEVAGDDLPVAMHLAGSREEYRFVKYGSSPFPGYDDNANRGYVEMPPWLPTGVSPVHYALNWGVFEAHNILAIHCVHVDPEDVKILRDYDVAIATCPRCNAQLGMGIAPISEYRRLGMRVGLGTDSPAATDSTDMIAEMRIGMLLHRAASASTASWSGGFVTANQMLAMATMGGARALHMEDRIGSLEIGKRADIIAVDLAGSMHPSTDDPVAAVVNAASGQDVCMTMVDGKILYEQNRWNVDVDVAKSIARVIGIRGKLRG